MDEVVADRRTSLCGRTRGGRVDLWASVPIDVGKGVVVNGDLAKPTSRTVFSLTARRGEGAASLQARAERGERRRLLGRSNGLATAFKEPA